MLRNICCVLLYLPILHELKALQKAVPDPQTSLAEVITTDYRQLFKTPWIISHLRAYLDSHCSSAHWSFSSVPPTNLFHKQNTFLGHKSGVSSSGA